MTGPDGGTSRGWWRFLAVEPGRRIEVEDGFADEDGSPDDAFEGELLESDPPHRAVTTERMIGVDGPGTTDGMETSYARLESELLAA